MPHKLGHRHIVSALKKARDVADLKAVSQNLMHASLTITFSIYGVLVGDDVSSRIASLSLSDKAEKPSLRELLEQIKRLLLEKPR